MIVRFDHDNYENVGNKAKFLMILKREGFDVPDGFTLDINVYDEIIEFNNVKSEIDRILKELTLENIDIKSGQIEDIIGKLIVPENLVDEILANIDSDKKYAVRSSGSKEDLGSFSFAGQYKSFMNINGIDNILTAVIDCYRSMYSNVILSYLVSNGISLDNLKMAVVVQEMVDSEMSGVVFTINPMTGNDKEIVVEIAEGLGENVVNGQVVPERYIYDWYNNNYKTPEGNKLLNEKCLNDLMQVALNIQIFFGYPSDIEFAFNDGKLHILQARAVTKIKYSKIIDIWSTADFKDGGVSATVCTPFMWSLYEYIWEFSLKKFMLDSKILKKSDLRKLGDMFYGRPYWNLSVVKKALSLVPGYKEREFDLQYGVKMNYEGDGQTTNISPRSIAMVIRVALAQKKILKTQNENIEKYKTNLLEKYYRYNELLEKDYDKDEFEQIWYKLTKDDYLDSEGTYFWQIFINTLHQSLYKDNLLKYIDNGEYLSLLSGIDNISHLLPFYDIWDISRTIRRNQASFDFWTNTDVKDISAQIDSNEHNLGAVRKHIKLYGYHSDKELDVTYPCYNEDINTVIRTLKDTVVLSEDHSPMIDKARQKKEYEKQLNKIKSQLSDKKYEKILNKTVGMRKMLWWREEFRDISTRFYFIIRIYTVRLSKYYASLAIIDDESDIWFLKIEDIWDFIDGKITKDNLTKIINRNKKYYQSFRNFTSENEIGSVFDQASNNKKADINGIFGVGCNNGIVTGTARVIESLDDIGRLQVNDILITKFTDTGWTSKFAVLSGIVTEYGGILCHSAIVSREYGIPCIVCAENVTKRIKDGSTIEINGTTGEVKIIKE